MREHVGRRAVGLGVHRLGHVDLRELDLVRLHARRLPGQVLRLGRHADVARVVDELLHRVLDELVERVELLPHEPLLLKVCRDDRPRVLLLDLLVVLLHVVSHGGRAVRRHGSQQGVGGGFERPIASREVAPPRPQEAAV